MYKGLDEDDTASIGAGVEHLATLLDLSGQTQLSQSLVDLLIDYVLPSTAEGNPAEKLRRIVKSVCLYEWDSVRRYDIGHLPEMHSSHG